MKNLFLAAVVISFSSSLAQAQETQIFQETEQQELQGQDIDANLRLLEALTREAKKGPRFRVSPDKIFMNLDAGSVGAQTVRISNVGDEGGEVNGVNGIGSIDGLTITDNCPPIVSPGAFCDVAVRFESSSAQKVQTVIVATIKERDRSSFDIPLQIDVSTPVVEVVDEPVVTAPEPAPKIVFVEPDEPKGPDTKRIAGSYFSGLGGPYTSGSRSGTKRVTKPESLNEKSVYGVNYSDVSSEYRTTANRYDDTVPSVDASLSVNRDMILTSDRVIKAVLDTPVSNIMCGKVVAVVESDVYSATGDVPLIQAGSRAIGSCGEFAEERVGIAWSRIITTDGRSISFDNGSVATNDASGLGGGLGRVYRSNFDRFVLPIISTMVDTTAGVIFATFGDDEEAITTGDGSVVQGNSSKNEGLRIITGEARGTAQELISEIRDVREVMVLPAGSRIDIEISQDIYFKDRVEIVRLGEVEYEVNNLSKPEISDEVDEDFILIPFRNGMTGPTVFVDGRKYIVSQKPEEETVKGRMAEPKSKVMQDLTPSEDIQ